MVAEYYIYVYVLEHEHYSETLDKRHAFSTAAGLHIRAHSFRLFILI